MGTDRDARAPSGRGGAVRTAAAYARRIEALWRERSGRVAVLSPRDWSLIDGWFERGVPLAVVCEAIDGAFDRASRGARRPPASLARVAAEIDEAWAVIRRGRLRPAATPATGRSSEGAWRRRLAAEPTGSPLAFALGRLLERLDAGEDRGRLDAALDDEIGRLVDAGLLRAARAEVDATLAPYRARIDPTRFAATRRRAIAAALRRRLDLPALAET